MEGIEELRLEIQSSRLSRRDVLTRAMGLGLSAPIIAGLLAACGGDDDETETADAEPTTTSAAAEPTATSAAAVAQVTPTTAANPTTTGHTVATEVPGKGRGQGDLLRIAYTNAATILNPHLAATGHSHVAASAVLEPLLLIDSEANLVPALAAEVPSLENGGLAEDGMSVTYTLRDDVVWSDGMPFTAEDVRFTWEFITHPETNSTMIALYRPVKDVEVVDEHTVTIHFNAPNAAWFVPFSTGMGGQVIPKHILQDFMGANAQEAPFNLKPIGTGPYTVAEFRPGDSVLYEINENYRFTDKPFFQRVEFIGGGEAVQIARSVLQTEEADYTFFMQIEKVLLEQMQTGSPPGELVTVNGRGVERIQLNLTDPNTEVDGERAKLGVPHPFQADRAVREAFTFVPDRDTIAEELFGVTGFPTANTLVSPPRFASPNTSYEFNLEQAAQLLDEAGWIVQDGVRQKDGVEMRVLFQTSVIALRQKVQEIIKQALESLGIPTELKAIQGSVFFSSEAGNIDTLFHFYADWQMYWNQPSLPYPTDYMAYYKSNEPEVDIAQQVNGWTGRNAIRWINEEYNVLYEQALSELDPEKQAELFIRMNDLIVKEDIVEIPLIHRSPPSAKNKKLKGNVVSTWDSDLWDIANWYWEE